MSENNKKEVATIPQKERFSVAIRTDAFQNLIQSTLGDKTRALNFIAAVSSVVATNPSLQECDHNTVVSAALLAESLKLAHSPQLGYYYMVPFKEKTYNPETKKRDLIKRIVATFVMGYKGYIQLAIRSGFYKRINVVPLKSGELISWDPMNEEIEVKLISDDAEREKSETTGYFAFFEYLNGFRKSIYFSKKRMMAHANKYSEAFNADDYDKLKAGKIDQKDMWKYSSYWYEDFDGMAMKTMLRQLLSKWGLMSVEMQRAFEADTSFEDKEGNRIYPDNPNTVIQEIQDVKEEVIEKTAKVDAPEITPSGAPHEETIVNPVPEGQTNLFEQQGAKEQQTTQKPQRPSL